MMPPANRDADDLFTLGFVVFAFGEHFNQPITTVNIRGLMFAGVKILVVAAGSEKKSIESR